jgi:hypothetical protein
MSERFPFPTKLNPIWWLKNSDQPGNEWGNWLRNPCHNFFWYVAGAEDRSFYIFGRRGVDLPDIGNTHFHLIVQAWPPFICPFFSFIAGKWQGYIGWRSGGALGARITRKP